MPKHLSPAQRKIEEEVFGTDVSVRSSIIAIKIAEKRLQCLVGSSSLADHENMNIQDVVDSLRSARAYLSLARRNRLAKRARLAKTRLF